MLEKLKIDVCAANIALKEHGLVVLTWGNVSAIDREKGLIVIKPSGVPYDELTPENMVVVDLCGRVVEGNLNPSSDTPTHVYLYKKYEKIGAVVHTHSTFATAFAQAGQAIPALGTTHADAFYGDVPCTRHLGEKEVAECYEESTGKVIAEVISDPEKMPAALVRNHGAFTFGKTAKKAVDIAVTLEETAKIAYLTKTLDPSALRVPEYILDKHYFRKHGDGATYGQKDKE